MLFLFLTGRRGLGSREKLSVFSCALVIGILLSGTVRGQLYNVRDYGAAGDGYSLDTAAINQTIQACASKGGGAVFFPAGKYLSGSIELKSRITLHLDVGATILGAPNDIHAYNPPEPLGFEPYQDFGHSHWKNSLIWGIDLEDIQIIGQGMIDGGGMSREDPPVGGGDKTIALKCCRNILIRDITIQKAGHFAILPTGCDNMRIDSITIDTNRDGINLDCCKNVMISNCIVNTPMDDAIVPKSSYALGKKQFCENVVITNCLISGYKVGTVLDGTCQRCDRAKIPNEEGIHLGTTGGIKLGTESNGGFRNISISNCVLDKCRGIALEIVDGGIMENINIINITMRDISESRCPIYIRLGNRGRGPNTPPAGIMKNINISNIIVTNADFRHGSIISGIPGHDIENVRLSNMYIQHQGGGTPEDSRRIPPEAEKEYPMPDRFGERMPSYGFYCRHVKGLEFHNVQITFMQPDYRPALICNDVKQLVLDNFQPQWVEGKQVPVILQNVHDVRIYNSPPWPTLPEDSSQKTSAETSKN